jgi:hypothetical protein
MKLYAALKKNSAYNLEIKKKQIRTTRYRVVDTAPILRQSNCFLGVGQM